MISEKTLERIWKHHREINVGKKLLEEMKRINANIKNDDAAEKLRDAFGRERDLQMGIPCGENAHTLINVSPKLAESVITAHIANHEAGLVEANEQAKIELGMQQ